MTTLTKKGYDQFHREHTKLTKDRVLALQDMVRMRDFGDLSENAGYRAAKGKLRRIDNRIRFLEKLLRTARVASPLPGDLKHIVIGAQVTLHDSNKTFQYSVVDSIESDIVHGKISIRSPLGRALMGKKVGDVVKVHTPQGIRSVTIDSLWY